MRGPNIMKGYLNNEEATKETIDDDGWLHTGDVAIVDSDGYFSIVDRVKELIKFKGFQVAPAELEALLQTHPAVGDAAVVPLPDNPMARYFTSPLKLFEYMALGCAIVSTPLPECRMYRSVLIGERGQPFLDRVDEALKLRSDPAYRDLLRWEAEENSWTSKARDLIALVEGRGTEQAALAPTAGTRQAS